MTASQQRRRVTCMGPTLTPNFDNWHTKIIFLPALIDSLCVRTQQTHSIDPVISFTCQSLSPAKKDVILEVIHKSPQFPLESRQSGERRIYRSKGISDNFAESTALLDCDTFVRWSRSLWHNDR